MKTKKTKAKKVCPAVREAKKFYRELCLAYDEGFIAKVRFSCGAKVPVDLDVILMLKTIIKAK